MRIGETDSTFDANRMRRICEMANKLVKYEKLTLLQDVNIPLPNVSNILGSQMKGIPSRYYHIVNTGRSVQVVEYSIPSLVARSLRFLGCSLRGPSHCI
jgi:predicted proteasome-type protease